MGRHGRRQPPPGPVPAGAGRSRARDSTHVLHRRRGYVALTKPRIIELLLITTVPTMVLAEQGWPVTSLVRHAARRHARRRRRQRHQHVRRPRHRRLMERTQGTGRSSPARSDRATRSCSRRARGRSPSPCCGARQPAERRPRLSADRLLRRRLHPVAQAHQHAEHRDRRRRRCRAGARRLGGGAPDRSTGRRRPVRRDVPVDAAALLGARHQVRRRLPRRRRPDAAGRGPAREAVRQMVGTRSHWSSPPWC
jgi:hypothetical protein